MTARRPHIDPGPDWVCLGQISGAIGVRGELRVKSFTADPAALASYGALTVQPGGQTITLALVRVVKDGLAMRADGITDRTAAEAMKGKRLYVARAALPEPEDEDDFYHADLLGLPVEDESGQLLGKVKAIHDFGAGDVLDIMGTGDSPGFMVPFTKAVVPVVDIPGGRIVVLPPQPASPEDKEPSEQQAGGGK